MYLPENFQLFKKEKKLTLGLFLIKMSQFMYYMWQNTMEQKEYNYVIQNFYKPPLMHFCHSTENSEKLDWPEKVSWLSVCLYIYV